MYALYWVPFLVKSDYLCLKYGDKRIIFKADADAAIIVAGHFFQVLVCVSVSWLQWITVDKT